MPRLAALFALLSFLVVGAFGFVHMMQMEQQPMMQGCPFMPQDDDTCMMTALAHFEAWMRTFISTLPGFFVLALIATAVLAELHRLAHTDDPTNPVPWRNLGIPPPLYQLLFAKGLLHPKVYA